MRAPGYPKSGECPASWIDEPAPGLREGGLAIGPRGERVSPEEELQAVAELGAGMGPRAEARRLQMGLDARGATSGIVKKDPGTDPSRLTSRERVLPVDSPRGRRRLKEPLAAVGMARSGCECAANAVKGPEAERGCTVREAVAGALRDSGGAYGCRRPLPEVNDAPESRSASGPCARSRGAGPGRPRAPEEARIRLVCGRGARGAREYLPGREGRASLQRRQAERAVDHRRHRVPHPCGRVPPVSDKRPPRRDVDRLACRHVARRRARKLGWCPECWCRARFSRVAAGCPGNRESPGMPSL